MHSTKNVFKKKVKGFTLTEVLLVLAIIGILVLLALPDQVSVVSKAKALEAKLQLKNLHTMQKSFFYEKSKYSNSLDDIGFEQSTLITEGGDANYRIEISEYDVVSYKATATAVVDFNQDGKFNVWEIDEKNNLVEVVRD